MIVNGLFIFGIVLLVWALIAERAPEGWEDDETGFHYGRKDGR